MFGLSQAKLIAIGIGILVLIVLVATLLVQRAEIKSQKAKLVQQEATIKAQQQQLVEYKKNQDDIKLAVQQDQKISQRSNTIQNGIQRYTQSLPCKPVVSQQTTGNTNSIKLDGGTNYAEATKLVNSIFGMFNTGIVN